MSNCKKLIIAALAVIFLVGATPALADPVYWSGTGERIPWEESPGHIVYPWFQWHGTLMNGSFQGEWEECTDKYPTYPFFGSIIYYYTPGDDGPTFAHCEGDWCIDFGNGTLLECGWFTMEFNMTEGTCEGHWESFDGFIGTMWSWGAGD